MSKRIFSLILSVVMIISCGVFVCAEETEENTILTFNCGNGTVNYKDLGQYKGNSNTNVNTVYDGIEKEITVTNSANYTFSINIGKVAAGNVLVYIGRVEGGEIGIAATGALDTIENRVLFTDVPFEAGVSYKVTIYNLSSATLRVQDIVLEESGEYLPDVKDLRVLAKNYSTGKISNKYQTAVALLPNYYLHYKLKPGAGNYKVSVRLKYWRGNPKYIDMHVGSEHISRTDTTKVTGSFKNYDFGTISVTDDEFTLKFTLPAKEATASYGDIYFYYITLERIDEPVVTVHSSDTPSATNVITNLAEGTMTAKAYLPETVKDNPVTMIFAIYDGNELYKVEKTVVEAAAKNQTVTVTLPDVAFEEGKTYTSKVFILNDMVNIQALYKNPTGGSLVSATESVSAE